MTGPGRTLGDPAHVTTGPDPTQAACELPATG